MAVGGGLARGRRRHTPRSARVSFKGFGISPKMLSAPGENDEAGKFFSFFFTLRAPEVDVVSARGLAGLQQKRCQNCQFALVDQLKGSWFGLCNQLSGWYTAAAVNVSPHPG